MEEILTTISPKHLKFLYKWLELNFNGTKAYEAVYKGVEESTANVNASKLLADTKIKVVKSYLLQQLITATNIENEIAKLALGEHHRDKLGALALLTKVKGMQVDVARDITDKPKLEIIFTEEKKDQQ